MDRYTKIAAKATKEGLDELEELVYKAALVSRAMQIIPGIDEETVDGYLDMLIAKYRYVDELNKHELIKELDRAYGGERNIYGRSDPRLP